MNQLLFIDPCSHLVDHLNSILLILSLFSYRQDHQFFLQPLLLENELLWNEQRALGVTYQTKILSIHLNQTPILKCSIFTVS